MADDNDCIHTKYEGTNQKATRIQQDQRLQANAQKLFFYSIHEQFVNVHGQNRKTKILLTIESSNSNYLG